MVSRTLLLIEKLSEKQILWILVAMTFGLRLYSVVMAGGISYDGAGYGFVARDFLRHDFAKGLSSALHPFYPFLIFLFSPNTSCVEITGRFVSLFFGTFAVIPLFYLVKKAVGQREALFSALFYTFHSYLVAYSGMLLTEATYWGWLILSAYFFWTGLKNEKLWSIVLSGFFLGLAYLTRPEGIGYVFVYGIWMIADGGLKKNWLKRSIHFGGLTVMLFLFVIPYVIYIHQETGQWLITKKGALFQSALLNGAEGNSNPPTEKVLEEPKSVTERRDNPPTEEVFEEPKSVKEVGDNRPMETVLEDPKSVVKRSYLPMVAKNIVQFLPSTTYHYLRAYHFALWLFLFLGLIRARQNGIKGELFLASFVLFHLFSLSTFTGSTIRFSVPLIPISLFWAGAGVLEIRKHLKWLNLSHPEKWVPFFIILALLVQLPQSIRPEGTHRADQKRVGLWLKENTPKDAVIMGSSPIETFYGEREFVLLPAGVYLPGTPAKSYKEIIRYAKAKRVGYILVNKEISRSNPDFTESIQSTDLKEFYRYTEKERAKIIVYEVIY